MELIVLGCSGTYPRPGSACSGYLVQEGHYSLWVDCGNGSLSRLQEFIPLDAVDAIVLTHLHADHCVEIVPFYYALRYGKSTGRRIPVYAPAGAESYLGALLSAGSSKAFEAILDFEHVGAGDALDIGPFKVQTYRALHPVETLALRIESRGHVLAYSADTGPCPEVVEAARDADLFLCEATFQDDDLSPPKLHLRASEAGALAREAGVSRLAITHVWGGHDPRPSLGQAAATFGGVTFLASDGMSLEVGS
ncbi:MAG: MBL fold metallo-hydrolase [Actinomycetota bacterium]